MLAKRFFYVCAGLLCLTIAFQMGPKSAGAQAGSSVTGFAVNSTNSAFFVLTANGDVFASDNATLASGGPARLQGNFWGGYADPRPLGDVRGSQGAVPVTRESIKVLNHPSEHRGEALRHTIEHRRR